MFETFVWPVISDSACKWGTRKYGAIKSVFNRACRFFLGLGQHAPVSAVRGGGGGHGNGTTTMQKRREELFIHASYINDDFMQMSGTEKLVFLFSDSKITQRCAKTCNTI